VDELEAQPDLAHRPASRPTNAVCLEPRAVHLHRALEALEQRRMNGPCQSAEKNARTSSQAARAGPYSLGA
jgi:hypothetical protein